MKRLITIVLLISGAALNIYGEGGGPRTTPTYDILPSKYAIPYSYTIDVDRSSQSNHFVMSRTILSGNLEPVIYSFGESAGGYEIYSQKKGIGQGLSGGKLNHEQAAERIHKVHGSWYYNWTFDKNDWVSPAIEFCPRNQHKWSNSANVTNAGYFSVMLGYNEPYYDIIGNEPTVQQALDSWPYIMSNAYLYAQNGNGCLMGSPTTENTTEAWGIEFLTNVFDNPVYSELTVDFIDIHNYSDQSDNKLVNDLETRCNNHWNEYGLPIWITEWNIADWGTYDGFLEEKVYTETLQALHYLESDPHVARYALFPFDDSYTAGYASTTFLEHTSTLAVLGELYCNYHSSDIDGPYIDIPYYIHNKQIHRRLFNNGVTVSTADIWTDGVTVEMEIAGIGNGYYYIQNGDDRLVDNAGTLIWSTTESGDSAKWTLTHFRHGYFYIDNLGTGNRLSTNVNVPYVDTTPDTLNASKWAFPRANPESWDVVVIEQPEQDGNNPENITSATIIGEFLIPGYVPETVTIIAESDGITRQTIFEITE